jgi:hypothetical protein
MDIRAGTFLFVAFLFIPEAASAQSVAPTTLRSPPAACVSVADQVACPPAGRAAWLEEERVRIDARLAELDGERATLDDTRGPAQRRWLPIAVAGAGLAAILGGGGPLLVGEVFGHSGLSEDTYTPPRAQVRAAIAGGAVGSALLLTGLTLWLQNPPGVERRRHGRAIAEERRTLYGERKRIDRELLQLRRVAPQAAFGPGAVAVGFVLRF